MITLLEDSNEDWWKVINYFLLFKKNHLVAVTVGNASTINAFVFFSFRGRLKIELVSSQLTLFREYNRMRRFLDVSEHSSGVRNRGR